MSDPLLFAFDLVAVAVLTFVLCYPRHRRSDMLVAYLVVNVGVLAVAVALASAPVGLGFGLGLFGVLAIIRLRSAELAQHEIAYYFAALSLGLVAGIGTPSAALTVGLMVAVLGALFVGDHPRLTSGHRSQRMVLEGVHTDEAALVGHLEGILGARVDRVSIRKVDMVLGSTQVDVRYTLPAPSSRTDTTSTSHTGSARSR